MKAKETAGSSGQTKQPGPRLANHIAIVTGAATGIGAAIVRRFRSEGAEVVAAGLQAEELKVLAAETGALAVECDVTDELAVGSLIKRTVARFGRLNVVVNAAGIAFGDYVANVEDRAWKQMLEVNLEGTMRVCRAAIPVMKDSGGGVFVNIASVAAFNSTPGWASYSATKAGVVSLTRSIANAYGQDGIRANCLCPGLVRTRLTEREIEDVAASRGVSVDLVWDEIAAQTVLKRVATPDDMAGCALFLASSDASMVTGATLVADGGTKIPPVARAA